jgi:hypothetical protein
MKLLPRDQSKTFRTDVLMYVEYIFKHYKQDISYYPTPVSRMTQESVMEGAIIRCTAINWLTSATEDGRNTISYLLELLEFSRKPAYVQESIIREHELNEELTKLRNYIAWQKEHLVCEKFHKEPYINVQDILHAMEQAGV